MHHRGQGQSRRPRCRSRRGAHRRPRGDRGQHQTGGLLPRLRRGEVVREHRPGRLRGHLQGPHRQDQRGGRDPRPQDRAGLRQDQPRLPRRRAGGLRQTDPGREGLRGRQPHAGQRAGALLHADQPHPR
ncbi:hypothetical protein ACU686_32730 [Yinghuangia aomiensis]